MRRWARLIGWMLATSAVWTLAAAAGEVRDGADGPVLWLDNGRVRLEVRLVDGKLSGDRLAPSAGAAGAVFATDADFALDVVWTDWRAPGKIDNGDNPTRLGKSFFRVERHEVAQRADGAREIVLRLRGVELPLEAALAYRLAPDDFFVRRRLVVSDPKGPRHFLRAIWPVAATLAGAAEPVKRGGFGQPVALRLGADGGAFAGLEYPAADNGLARGADGPVLRCGQEIGERIGPAGIASDWAVLALTPDARVKHWFMRYLDRVRAAPLRPYMLYNSWYDLRSPELATEPGTVMSEANVLRIVELFRRNMTEPYGLRLDAFVLDDGWDVYRSDWALRTTEFPRGLRPIADELAKTGTALGIWFGPTGGYSKRAWRLEWMKDHGYETVGDQFCVAGTNYRGLLGRRVGEFIARDGVGYFKWDGIQFACSEPDHGHPVDIYSRRAVLGAVAELAAAARAGRPGMFLNITSGTWLSPWWLRHADQIWMGGEDYGWADVPSISRRDAAITYRDAVLYEDFHEYDFWFPLANLMTHGIIKGRLEKLGGEADPLDKFTDDVLLYFARGVSMHEFYISPDLLTDGEWRSIAESARWANDRFPVLMHTEMVGGNPLAGEPYGYVHFDGTRGVVAARNPFIAPARLAVPLAWEAGLDRDADGLVVERVYPDRWVSPRLYRTGDMLDVELSGYETAVYELYPLAEAPGPLLAGVRFDQTKLEGGRMELITYPGGPITARVLNPETASSVSVSGVPAADLGSIGVGVAEAAPAPGLGARVWAADAGAVLTVEVEVGPDVAAAEIAILLQPAKDLPPVELPELACHLDYKRAVPHREQEAGKWAWLTLPVAPGKHTLAAKLPPAGASAPWKGTAKVWLVARHKRAGVPVVLEAVAAPAPPRPLPPRPWPAGEVRVSTPLGMAEVAVAAGK